MEYTLTVHVPHELQQPLIEIALSSGQAPEDWIVTLLRQKLPQHDERLRHHFGAINLGHPTVTDNTTIDAELAAAYARVANPEDVP